jgi:polysaccharide chain length determinant protein (PEP-CTERM system associated)
MQEHGFHPLDYLSLVRRRRWWLLAPIALCVGVGVILALVLPRVYRSHATVGVSLPKVSTNLIGGAAPLSREERIQAISEQLLSRPVLERVAREEGLTRNRPVQEVVDEMLQPQRIKVEPTELLKQMANEKSQFDAFLLSYADGTPELAQRVTNRLALVFVEVTSQAREQRAEGTSEFIGAQLVSSRERLDSIEARLREAKEAYMGSLPEQTDANLSMASGLRQQLESTAIALRGEQDRLTMIERQLEAMKKGVDEFAMPAGSAGGARLLQIQRQLAEARANYTEKHPEIQRLQDELAQAKREAEQAASQPESDRLSLLRADPAYAQLEKDQAATRIRIRELQMAERQARAQLGVYQSRVESAPRVEQQLRSVQREYDLEKQQYTALSEKLQQAQLNESLERRRSGEQFKVLHAAYFPAKPESPDVLRLLLIAVGLGLGLGAAAVFGREYFDRSVYDVRALQTEFDVPVLGEISTISPSAHG